MAKKILPTVAGACFAFAGIDAAVTHHPIVAVASFVAAVAFALIASRQYRT